MRGGVMSAGFVEVTKRLPLTASQFVFQSNPVPGAGPMLLNAPE